MFTKIKGLLRYGLAKTNRKVVHLDSFGQSPVIDALDLLGNVSEKLSVFDVGANAGSFSEEIIRRKSNIVVNAFEPFPAAFRDLSRLEERHRRDFRAHNFALSDVAGEREFFINAQSVTNSLLPNAACSEDYQPGNYATPVGTIEVKLETLDSFCKNESISKIHLLKIDTQGADLKVLKGGEQMIDSGRVCMILVEVLFVPLYEGQCWFGDIYGWLTSKGFKLVNLYDVAHASETKEAKWADALFVNNSAM